MADTNYSFILSLVFSQLSLIDTSLPDVVLAIDSVSVENILTIWVAGRVFANKLQGLMSLTKSFRDKNDPRCNNTSPIITYLSNRHHKCLESTSYYLFLCNFQSNNIDISICLFVITYSNVT